MDLSITAETQQDNPTGAKSDMSGPWEQYQQTEGPSEAPVSSAGTEEVRAPWDMYAEDSKNPVDPGVTGLKFEDNSADGEITAGQMAGGLAMDTLKGTIHSIKWIPDAVEMVAPNPVTGKAKRIIDDSLEYADTLESDSYRAMKNKEIVGKDENGDITLSAPSVGQAAGLVLETLPQIPQMLVGGGLIGKGLVKAGLGAKAAVPAGYGAMNSLMSTPESYHDTYKEALVEGQANGLKGQELDDYATERANTAALIVAPLTAVTGAAGLGGAAKVGAGTEGLIKAVVKGVAADTPAEAVESYGQSAAGDVAMEREIDQAKALDQGAKGAVAGGVMGGATSAKHSIESKIIDFANKNPLNKHKPSTDAAPAQDVSDLFEEETTSSPDQPPVVDSSAGPAQAAETPEVVQGKNPVIADVMQKVDSGETLSDADLDALFSEEDKGISDEEYQAVKDALSRYSIANGFDIEGTAETPETPETTAEPAVAQENQDIPAADDVTSEIAPETEAAPAVDTQAMNPEEIDAKPTAEAGAIPEIAEPSIDDKTLETQSIPEDSQSIDDLAVDNVDTASSMPEATPEVAVEQPAAPKVELIQAPKGWDRNLVVARQYAKNLGIQPGEMKMPELRDVINSQVASDEFDAAAHQAATSDRNDVSAPTQAQIEAGNYKKGKVSVHGLNVSVENPAGSKRSGIDGNGKVWSHKMSDHYGYIRGTTGADGDHVDVYVGKNPSSDKVYIVDQIHQADGKFDEHKVMMGYDSKEAAIKAYRSNFDAGWKVGKVSELPAESFKTWLKEGDTKKPFFGSKAAKEASPESMKTKSAADLLGDEARADSFDAASKNRYKNEDSAKDAMGMLGLKDTHKVVKVGREFFIRPTDETIARYRRADGETKGDGVGKDKELREAIKGKKELEAVHIVPSFDALPAKVREKALADGLHNGVKGVYHEGTSYVIANSHKTLDDAIMTVVHEEVGHRGIHAVLKETITPVMDSIYSSTASKAAGKAELDRIRAEYASSLKGKTMAEQRSIIAEEYVAGIIEKGGRATVVDRFIAGMRSALRSVFPNKVRWSNTDILSLAERSRRWLTKQNEASFRNAESDMTELEREVWRKTGGTPVKESALDYFRRKADRAGLKFRQGVVDKYAALKEMDIKLHGTEFLSKAIHSSAWVRARMSPTAAGVIEGMLNYGRVKWDANEQVMDMRGDGSLGLGSVLNRLGDAHEIDRFFRWIAGNRAEILKEQGRENLLNDQEIAVLKNYHAGKTESGADRASLYRDVYSEFKQYRDDVLEMAENTGVISAETRAMWRDEFYVPFYRVAEKPEYNGPTAEKGLTRTDAIKQLKGGTEHLNDLLTNTINNFHHLVDNSLRNVASTQALKNAEKLGIAKEVTVDERDWDTSTYIMRDGKRVFYEVNDPLVFEAIAAMIDPGSNSKVVNAMAGFKRVFTQSTTVTPQFIVANLIRDALAAPAASKVGFNPLKNTAQGIAVWKDREKRARMIVSGASFHYGNTSSTDAKAIRKTMKDSMSKAQIVEDTSKVGEMLQKGWDHSYGAIMEATENASRAAIWEQNLSKGKLAAAFEARDLMDFSANGSWAATRFLIRTVPFLNARIQGLDKLYRGGVVPTVKTIFGKGTASDKAAAARFSVVTGALSIASMMLRMVNEDDEEYKKLDDWQKDSYWFIRAGDNAYFIPKPFEVGSIATLTERLLEQVIDDEATPKDFGKAMWFTLTQTFGFSPVPQAVGPAMESYFNYNSFSGRPIETPNMQKMDVDMRSRLDTTRVAKGLSKLSGDTISPVKADALINGYLGQVGGWGAGMVDAIWDAASGKKGASKSVFEYQPFKRFYRDTSKPEAYNRYTGMFYDALTETQRAYVTATELRDQGKAKEALEYAQEHKDKMGQYKILAGVSSKMSKISKAQEDIKHSDLDSDAKRRELDRLQLIKNNLSEIAAKKLVIPAKLKEANK
jgi:hypothetical protein